MSDSTPSSGPQATPDPNLPAWARKQQEAADPLSDERLEAFIGPRWLTYQKKFAQYREDPSFVPSWNWSAALFGFGWFLYRKLYLAAFGFLLIQIFVLQWLVDTDSQLTLRELAKPENQQLQLANLAVQLSSAIAAGGLGNWLLFRRFRAAVLVAKLQDIPSGEVLPWLTRVGGINRLGAALALMMALMNFYALAMA